MSLPALAPVSALETRLGLAAGTLAGADLARAQANLGDVSSLVRAEASQIRPGTTWVDPVTGTTITAPDEVVTVVCQAAKRAYENPSGYSGENVGDYGYQVPVTGVYLTVEEKAIVKRAARGATVGPAYDTRTPSAFYDPTAYGVADPGYYFWGLEQS